MTLDTTTRRVRALVLNEAAEAYGYRQSLTDEQSRSLHPEQWCRCGHHTSEHHGPEGNLDCSARACPCTRMESN
jgi:hypothetical protein